MYGADSTGAVPGTANHPGIGGHRAVPPPVRTGSGRRSGPGPGAGPGAGPGNVPGPGPHGPAGPRRRPGMAGFAGRRHYGRWFVPHSGAHNRGTQALLPDPWTWGRMRSSLATGSASARTRGLSIRAETHRWTLGGLGRFR
ncbi:hypothetical protein BKD26_29075 [Streptomyces sp. CB03238]|nr:hypothetical protein BKD26_29075 [Streptomyces sp. CB03238]